MAFTLCSVQLTAAVVNGGVEPGESVSVEPPLREQGVPSVCTPALFDERALLQTSLMILVLVQSK